MPHYVFHSPRPPLSGIRSRGVEQSLVGGATIPIYELNYLSKPQTAKFPPLSIWPMMPEFPSSDHDSAVATTTYIH